MMSVKFSQVGPPQIHYRYVVLFVLIKTLAKCLDLRTAQVITQTIHLVKLCGLAMESRLKSFIDIRHYKQRRYNQQASNDGTIYGYLKTPLNLNTAPSFVPSSKTVVHKCSQLENGSTEMFPARKRQYRNSRRQMIFDRVSDRTSN